MCSERLIPFSAFAIIEDVVHQTFCQFRIVYQEQRSRRISDIHRTDRTVAEVLFWEEQQVFVGGFHQFVGSDCLAISQCTEFGILTSAYFSSFFHQVSIECSTFIHHCIIFLISFRKLRLNGFVSIAVPVRTKIFTEILNRVQVIVTQQQVSFRFLRFTQWANQCQLVTSIGLGWCQFSVDETLS